MEVAAGLVAGGEVLRRGGMEMRGRPTSCGAPAVRGGSLFWRHGGGGAHAYEVHVRAYGEREGGRVTGKRSGESERVLGGACRCPGRPNANII